MTFIGYQGIYTLIGIIVVICGILYYFAKVTK